MTALVNYIAKDVGRSLRWVAPVPLFVAALAVIAPNTGSVLPTYASSALLLFFVATWLTITICNNEDPVQRDVTSVAAGGLSRLRLAKLLTAYLAVIGLSALALIGPPLASLGTTTLGDLAVGAGGHLLSGLAGVSLGAVLSRPLVHRTAWAVLITVVVGFGDIAVPDAPPLRQLSTLLNRQPSSALGIPMALLAGETIVIAVVAISGSSGMTGERPYQL